MMLKSQDGRSLSENMHLGWKKNPRTPQRHKRTMHGPAIGNEIRMSAHRCICEHRGRMVAVAVDGI